ncbi:pyridoxamine 5'-phosphate oxidase family protein [Paenarthrobacter sp. Z7-10]|uniref:pyridoxamine 5'-phosphate oxidase family protein n=1 Tax=Paenarthrobacter sp. Z7-10 TaxID=2787635 RepID=UPI0022A9D43F|nr:pyridoxamine 5'-phosphate oxidase family protein [Paenarthrobacter sp. Z7-10]MCZ2402031.1 pyridoxamine 5'-phosphate oxidase family protein [Paenarthrobacter sp. Z7-10]
MSTNQPATRTEVLEESACWALLRGNSVGWLAVWVDDHPDIFPLNYTVDHATVVFRTGEGTKLSAAAGTVPVAMEADGVDADTGIAWSVVVRGASSAISRTDEVLETFSLMLFPWESGHKDVFIRISPVSITGRRFRVTPPAEWWTAQAQALRSAPE